MQEFVLVHHEGNPIALNEVMSRPELVFTLVVTGLLAMLSLQAEAGGGNALVPFVGCSGDGQLGRVDAPSGNPVAVDVDPVVARQLAYYAGKYGPGVFAPAGWHCDLWYGSNGTSVTVTPAAPTDTGTSGPRVELLVRDGGTSGRFEVARLAAQFFPAAMHDFIQKIKDEKAVDDPALDAKPYPFDQVGKINDRMMEIDTPGRQDGFGTTTTFLKSDEPVRSLVAISTSPDEPTSSVLRVRLGHGQDALSATIVKIEKRCFSASEAATCAPVQ